MRAEQINLRKQTNGRDLLTASTVLHLGPYNKTRGDQQFTSRERSPQGRERQFDQASNEPPSHDQQHNQTSTTTY